MNNEISHGITWHLMSETLDTGDVLKQVFFPVEAHETALGLNAKCYHAALVSFSELISELDQNRYNRTSQHLNQRTFFAWSKKPYANGLIDWTEQANSIEKTYRAFYFGDYDNAFSSLKILVHGRCFIILKMSLVPHEEDIFSKPGEIVNITHDALQIATARNFIAIEEIADIDGNLIPIDQWITLYDLKKGDVFPSPAIEMAKSLEKSSVDLFRHEAFWVKQWAHSNFVPLPYFKYMKKNIQNKYYKEGSLSSLKIFPFDLIESVFLSILIIYLHRITNNNYITIGITLDDSQIHLTEFFSKIIPFNWIVESKKSFKEMANSINHQLKIVRENKTFLRDIFLRYPALKNSSIRKTSFAIVFHKKECSNVDDPFISEMNSQLRVTYNVHKMLYTLALGGYPNNDEQSEKLLNKINTHLQQLINSVIENANQSIELLNFISPDERRWILAQRGTSTPTDFNEIKKTIPQIFKEIALHFPNKVAVVCEEKQITYAELNKQANYVAYFLKKNGVRTQEKVALYTPRSSEAVIAMLAILKIGAIYVPIDTDFPDSRVRYILQDTGALHLLTLDEYYQKAKIISEAIKKAIVLNLSEIVRSIKDTDYVVECPADPDHMAYILYTSGSTGQPKGVVIPCKGIIRLAKSQTPFAINAQDTLLHITRLSFDISMFEIWSTLLNRAKLVILPNKLIDPFLLAKKIKIERPIIFSTPSFFKTVINLVPDAYDNASLIILGGEPIDIDSIHIFLRRKKQRGLKIKIINAYGPTENSIVSTYYLVDSLENPIPIGRPLPGTTAYVLDQYKSLAPIGVPGELYLGGLGLSSGYLNKPELNKIAFIGNPYDLEDKRLYRTGDRVKWREDGNLEFIERLDSQIKLRGLRIELGEIEEKLKEIKGIDGAVVLLDRKKQYLIAYIQTQLDLRNRESNFVIKVREKLQESLPDYMIPTRFYIINEIPLTSHYKIDKEALLELEKDSAQDIKEVENLSYSYIEKTLIQYYQQILRINQVGIHHNFFRLGGNSLSAMELIARIEDKFNISMSFHHLFYFPEISQLAKFIEKSLSTFDKKEEIIPVSPPEEHNPLSFSQESLWLFEQLNSDASSVYNIPLLIELKRKPNKKLLQQAFDSLVERHSILRTVFFIKEDKPSQKTINNKKIKIIHYNMNKIKNNVGNLVKLLAKKPFSKLNDFKPLIRAYLIKIKKDDYRLLFVFHHILIDLESIEIIRKEIEFFYDLYSKKKIFSMLPLSIQYRDYSLWQQLNFKGDLSKAPLSYWKENLKDAMLLNTLTPDYVRPLVQRYIGKTICLELPLNLINSIKTLAIENDVTLFMALLSLFFILLRFYIRKEDIIIGVPINGRTLKGTQSLIGMFVNTLPIRVKLDPLFDFISLLKHVKSIFLEAHAHQNVSFHSLIQSLNVPSSQSWNPIFQIAFNMKYGLPSGLQANKLFSKTTLVSTDTAKFDLSLDIIEEKGKYYAHFEYNTTLFSLATIRALGCSFKHLLKQVSENPTVSLNKLSILDPSQYKKIVIEWNKTDKDYPLDQSIHQLFETQAEKTPHASALIAYEKTLNYQDLNEQANKVAHYLRKLNIRSEKIVLLYLNRSIDMIVSILAILKTGSAYLPVEPGYPDTRLEYIINEANPSLILTHSEFAEYFSIKTPIPLFTVDQSSLFCDNSTANIKSSVELHRPVSVIYTSGSTGYPKGVVNLQRGALNHLQWMKETYLINKTDRVLQKTTYMFDASFGEILLPLISGASLVLMGPQEHKDIYKIIELINQYQISIVQFVPSQLALFLEAIQPGECPSLKQVWCGGEVLGSRLINTFIDRCSAKLHNLYGTTETSDDTTHWLCDNTTVSSNQSVPIGKPIANTQCFVLDENLMPVPIGVPGDLYVGGVSLARGYLNQPALTSSKFIVNPFAKKIGLKKGELFYKTGDIVKWLHHGELTFIDRVDHQVQIRGFRVELSEIENVFLKHPSVQQAVVLCSDSDNDNINTNITAYLVFKNKKDLIANENIKGFLSRHLPYYMIPSHIVAVDYIPVTPSGKVDKNTLLSLRKDVITFTEKEEKQGGPIEEKIKDLWSSLLNVKEIRPGDDFFYLGGHSLAAARLMVHLQHTLGVKLPLASLFEHSTLSAFSRFVRHSISTEEFSSLIEILPPEIKIADNKKLFPAFFFVHPLGGSIFCYRDLAYSLVKRTHKNYSYRPFYAFESRGIYESYSLDDSIVQLARKYIIEMKKIQENGPYMIGGWSFGGLVAAEMVKQLEEMDEKVITLFLIDSTAQFQSIKQVNTENDHALLEFYESMFEIKQKNKTNNHLRENFIHLIEHGKAHSEKQYTSQETEQILRVARSHINALTNFELSILNTDITLLKAEHSHHDTPASGWDRYTTKKVNVFTFAGTDHWTILERKFIGKMVDILLDQVAKHIKI